ncbi:hypothetical protein [Tenacibaculum sp. 190524A02b]|uniref:hypothetical protein n=1 Tax=Tenacibaculum vairaonense TaxID=3137860 RepID=UPI0031FB57B0
MIEFYIEGHIIELGETKITQVYQINDIGEPKDRQLNYTYPINIPVTPNNLISLDMLGVKSSLSEKPYKLLRGKLVENGVEIIPDGVVIIKEKSNRRGKEFFKAHIYGGNIYLYEALGSKKLNELDLSEYDHEVTLENYISSFNNTEGYVYALSDFGKLDISEVEINYQLPSLFVHTVWDKVFKEAGVDYNGELFKSDKFRSLLITMFRGYNSEIDDINNPVNIVFTLTERNKDIIFFNSDYKVYLGVLIPEQPYITKINSNFENFGDLIQAPNLDVYNLSFDLELTLGNNEKEYNVFIEIVEAELTSSGIGNLVVVKELSIGRVIYGTVKKHTISERIQLEKDKYYFIRTRLDYDVFNSSNHIQLNQKVKDFVLKNSQEITFLDFSNYLGEMSQLQFVKDILQHFGLIHQKRRNQLIYDFKQVKTLINDRSRTIDWSDKFVNENKENYKLSKYAQSNIFAYNYLESDSVRFADGVLKISNETLPIQKTFVTRPYNAPTISEKKLLNNNLTNTPFWKAERDDQGKVKKYKPIQSKNYLCELKYINASMRYGITNSSKENYIGEIPLLDFSNLSYSQILQENYKELKEVLDFNNVVSANMRLNEIDIQNLDLFKTIFLKQYSSDFYINKIRYTSSSDLNKVELVKIKRTTEIVNDVVINSSIEILTANAVEPNVHIEGWSIWITYEFKNIETINAKIKAKHFTELPNNGGLPSGYELEANITDDKYNFYIFHLPNPLGDDKRGWYEISMRNDTIESNSLFVNVNPI